MHQRNASEQPNHATTGSGASAAIAALIILMILVILPPLFKIWWIRTSWPLISSMTFAIFCLLVPVFVYRSLYKVIGSIILRLVASFAAGLPFMAIALLELALAISLFRLPLVSLIKLDELPVGIFKYRLYRESVTELRKEIDLPLGLMLTRRVASLKGSDRGRIEIENEKIIVRVGNVITFKLEENENANYSK